MQRKTILKMAAIGMAVLSVGAAAACSSGISQKDLDAAKSDAAAQTKKAADLQQQLTSLQQAQAAQNVLLTAKQVPPPAPKPTPTPLAPGVTPPPAPPKPVVPSSFLQPVAIVIHADTVTSGAGESKFNYDPAGIKDASCVQSSVFHRGMHLVWRMEAVDTSTGKRLTDQEVDKALVQLPNGNAVTLRFGRHGATDDSPWFWTGSWDIPLDYPVGTLDWTITVTTKDGKTGTFKLWNVSAPAAGVEGRTQIL